MCDTGTGAWALLDAGPKRHLLSSFEPFTICVKDWQLPGVGRLISIEMNIAARWNLDEYISQAMGHHM